MWHLWKPCILCVYQIICVHMLQCDSICTFLLNEKHTAMFSMLLSLHILVSTNNVNLSVKVIKWNIYIYIYNLIVLLLGVLFLKSFTFRNVL
jgi:hypothetical protein